MSLRDAARALSRFAVKSMSDGSGPIRWTMCNAGDFDSLTSEEWSSLSDALAALRAALAEPEPQDEILSRDTFGHDDEIGRLFEEYDRLVRWEEHNSRLDATDPVVERAIARGRIVAFIANTATLQQDAHTSMNAEPEPQNVDAARRAVESAIYADYEISDERFATRFHALNRLEAAIRAEERSRYEGLLAAARDVKTFYHDGDEVGGYDGQDIIDNLVEALRPSPPAHQPRRRARTMAEQIEPLLGLATTRELLAELEVRMRVTQNSSKGRELGLLCAEALENLASGVLNYRTVGPYEEAPDAD